ncbi:MAG: PadR family transcriptional regulator [Senegalia sp. (in: firmicutes)]|uniref:PadR family transcriptional regulator n=1 Tax=Senegalia sp. (in: firmicutes) TaxID=1924098 RepID=UPI003F96CDA3
MIKHNRKGRFLEACLLCLLKEEKSYGYSLMEKLSDFGFMEDEVNISIIYRNLRAMEEGKLVSSSWSESEQGPNKRIYEITRKGIEELNSWIDFLSDRKKRITLIINKYETLK